MAFALPDVELDGGSVLDAWPEAKVRSNVIVVTRMETPPTTETEVKEPDLSPDCTLSIIEPSDQGKVVPRQTVRIQAHESCDLSEVWLVVHPTEISSYYVQPRPSEKAGVWKVDAYFGEPGRGRGATFEVKAVGRPVKRLHEGDELSYWPDAAVQSEYIEVRRK